MKRSELNARHAKWRQQRKERGFDNRELWNLDATISRFCAPRLRAFAKLHNAYPCGMTMSKWQRIVNKMARAHELNAEDGVYLQGKKAKQYREGMALFIKHYQSLWD